MITMADTTLTLLESDDLMHPNGGEANFNESAYYNFFDPRRRVGGFVRLGKGTPDRSPSLPNG